MKRFLLLLLSLLFLWGLFEYLYYYDGSLYLPVITEEVSCATRSEDGKLYIDKGEGFEEFTLKGVNLGLGKPGKFATDFSVTEEEYLRWFRQIQDLGANVIRTYTLAHPDFYRAFYQYNLNNPDPLYLIHGVWVDDYLINSSYSAFDPKFYDPFLRSCKEVVDACHGRLKQNTQMQLTPQTYSWDISPWVYGYILGIEWEGDLVVYTNQCIPQRQDYKGKYMQSQNGRNMEIFLASIGDQVIGYETRKYGSQRTIAFANWPTTCPIEFSEKNKQVNKKYGKVDMENIVPTENFKGAMFASYHIYPYYPEYVRFEKETEDEENTYLAYLKLINEHHSLPVVISEFGIPSSRGMASYEENRELGRDQGRMNEEAQGKALVSLYEDIMDAGSAGGIAFIWQDEWFKRTWNTISQVDLNHIIYWSDLQTNEQHFGLLSFDPGAEKRNCSVDGDPAEWTDEDFVCESQGFRLSMKTDFEGIYFLIEKEGLDLQKERIAIPIDLTPKSGSRRVRKLHLTCSDPADFLIDLNGRENSRLLVQARYNTIAAVAGPQLKHKFQPFVNPPEKDSMDFYPVHLLLHELTYYERVTPFYDAKISFQDFNFNYPSKYYFLTQNYETGVLHYGDGNPDHEDFDSLSDFCAGKDCVEVRIPWQILNFSDPVDLEIHDDYYEVYGIEYLKIDHMKVGVGTREAPIDMVSVPLEPLSKKPVYHERLKRSYYILQEYWKNNP